MSCRRFARVQRFGATGLALAAIATAVLAQAQPQAPPPPPCAVPAELMAAAIGLPHVAERVRARQPVRIVAIGGGSTAGAAAGGGDLAYPQRLQLALTHAFPEIAVSVVNRGVARQSAQEMVERFSQDVIAADPVLVVWETGISDAVRGTGTDDFAAALQTGIDELKRRAIDVILVDMQFSRKATALIDFERYRDTLLHVGEINDVYLFRRFQMMRYWSEQRVFAFDEVNADERARLAARVYDCIGRNLAEVIGQAVR